MNDDIKQATERQRQQNYEAYKAEHSPTPPAPAESEAMKRLRAVAGDRIADACRKGMDNALAQMAAWKPGSDECVCGGSKAQPNDDCERCQLVATINRLTAEVGRLKKQVANNDEADSILGSLTDWINTHAREGGTVEVEDCFDLDQLRTATDRIVFKLRGQVQSQCAALEAADGLAERLESGNHHIMSALTRYREARETHAN